MSRDTDRELKRLEEELLEEETDQTEEEEITDQYEELVGEDALTLDDDCFYNTDQVDEDPEALSEAVLSPQKEKLTGLTLAALLLFIAIMGVLIYWVVQMPPEFWKMLWNK